MVKQTSFDEFKMAVDDSLDIQISGADNNHQLPLYPSKPAHSEKYDDIFERLSPPSSRSKIKEYRPSRQKPHKSEVNPLDKGLPSVIIAELHPRFKLSKEDNDLALQKEVKMKIGVKDMGLVACKQIASQMLKEIDIKPAFTDFIEARGACVFQLTMNENSDDAFDWLDARDDVFMLEGRAPLDQLDSNPHF